MSVCRCTDTEVCFPCRDREAHRLTKPGQIARPASTEPLAEADSCPGISGLLERQREIELGYQGLVAGASQAPAEAPRFDPDAVSDPDDWPTAAELQRRQALREAAYPPPAEAPDVEPATDEQVAGWEQQAAAGGATSFGGRETFALIARFRQAEAEAARLRGKLDDVARACRRALEERDEWSARAEVADAEAARLREQVAALQAADAGAFW